MRVQSLPSQQKVARSGHCSAALHDGEESVVTADRQESR